LVITSAGVGDVAYVYIAWFYLYLVNERGVGVLRGAFFASGPFLAMTVLCPLGGWVTDRVVASVGVNAGRSRVGCVGMLLSGVCIVAGTQVAEPYTAITLLSLCAGCLYFMLVAVWPSNVGLVQRTACSA